MNNFRAIITYFNTKTCNKIFTRAEYMTAMRFKANYGDKIIKPEYLDNIRCYLMRAGYLIQEELGVYRKMKKIPNDISYTQLYREAYPIQSARTAKQLKDLNKQIVFRK